MRAETGQYAKRILTEMGPSPLQIRSLNEKPSCKAGLIEVYFKAGNVGNYSQIQNRPLCNEDQSSPASAVIPLKPLRHFRVWHFADLARCPTRVRNAHQSGRPPMTLPRSKRARPVQCLKTSPA